MVNPEIYGEIKQSHIDRVVDRVLDETGRNPGAEGRVRHLVQGFYSMLKEILEPGEELSLDVYRQLDTAETGIFIERTTTGLAIGRRAPNPNDPILPRSAIRQITKGQN